MAPSNGFGLVPNHRHVNTTLTGGIYRMVQPKPLLDGPSNTIFCSAESVDSESSTPHTPSVVLFHGRCLSWFLPGHSGFGSTSKEVSTVPG